MATTVKFRPKQYRNWEKSILPEIKNQQNFHIQQGIPGTVRGLLYIFESMGILGKKHYGPLSKHLVKWREEGEIDGAWIVDKTRRILDIVNYEQKGECIDVIFDENLQSYNTLLTPAERIESGLAYLKDVAKDFHNHIPMWLGQPKYLEAWVEKNAMGSSIYSILNRRENGLNVVTAPNGGWSSYTFAQDNLDRLLDQQRNKKEVYVQYYGDSDPSGERMTAPDSKMVRLLESNGINFERIAITDKTIRDFNMDSLKVIRDPGTLAKLRRDPNAEWFRRRHDGQLWQIEIDALQLNLPKFKDLVLSSARKHFDERIHKKVLKEVKAKYPEPEIKNELIEQIKDLAEELGLNCY